MKYVGVDIGKCRAAVMDPEGTIIEEFTFPNDAEGVSVQPVHRPKPLYVRKEKALEYEAGTLTIVHQSTNVRKQIYATTVIKRNFFFSPKHYLP